MFTAPLYTTSCFSFSAFSIVSLDLNFDILIMIYITVSLFDFILFGNCWAFCICMSVSFPKLKTFSAVLQTAFLPLSFFLSFWGLCKCLLLHLFCLQFSSVQSRLILCDPINCSTPGFPVHHQLPELTHTHVHRVSDAIQPSHPLPSPSPPTPNPFQHQGLFQWVNASHEVAKVLEFQLQHHSFQWTPRTYLL